MPSSTTSGTPATSRRRPIRAGRRSTRRPTRPRSNASRSRRKNTIRGARRGPAIPQKNRNNRGARVLTNLRKLLWAALALVLSVPALAWQHWGGDPGGTRFSPLAAITPANVDRLVKAWQFRTGDLDSRAPGVMARTKFEATPLLVEDSV